MTRKIPFGSMSRVLLSLARMAYAKGTVMPTQEQIAERIGRTPDAVYLAWRKMREAGAVRTRFVLVGRSRRVVIEEVRE